MLKRICLLIIALTGVASVTGCSPYVDDYYYTPHPAVAEVQAATTQPTQAVQSPVTVYATVVGIRRENRDEHIPLSIEVRLRVDNHGQEPVTFDPHSLDLTTGELLRFPVPMVTPTPISIAPGQSAVVQANFPFPPGLSYDNTNLQTLQLRWQVQINTHAIPQMADYRRVYRAYYDDPYWGGYGPYPYGYPYPYYGPSWGFGGTVVIRR